MRYTQQSTGRGIGDALSSLLMGDAIEGAAFNDRYATLADADYKTSKADEARSNLTRHQYQNARDQAETEKIAAAMALYQDPEQLSRLAALQTNQPVANISNYQNYIQTGQGVAPENGQEIGQVLAGLLLSGMESAPTKAPETSQSSMELSARQEALANRDIPEIAARINAALNGDMPYSAVGNTGAVLNQTDGKVSIDPVVAQTIAKNQAASKPETNKSFLHHSMPAELRAQIGSPKMINGQMVTDLFGQPEYAVPPEFTEFAVMMEAAGMADNWNEVARLWAQAQGAGGADPGGAPAAGGSPGNADPLGIR